MIQTKQEIVFGNRDEKLGKLKIEVRLEDDTNPIQNTYLVVDWNLSDDKDAYFSKRVFWTTEQIDTMNEYLEANYNFEGISKKEVDHAKLGLALMADTTTNLLTSGKTIYRQTPLDWEFSPEFIERHPTLFEQ